MVESVGRARFFGGTFFGLTGLHMLHVTIGVIYLASSRWALETGNSRPKTSRSADCTGTSSTSSGCSFSAGLSDVRQPEGLGANG